MKIELSDQQLQAVKQGHPVEVIDPATAQPYVLLAAEVYTKIRGALERPLVPASPSAASSGGQPLRQRVRDLPLPPEVAAEAQRHCTYLGLRGERSLRQVEEQMKFQHYYGGSWIAYLRTDEGPVVVAAADSLNDPGFEQQLSVLAPEERRRAILTSLPRLFDEQSEILTPFADTDESST
jgi:hypothetical protein